MSKRRKRLEQEAPTRSPALTGVAQLLSETAVATVDLHGYTVAQAHLRLRDFLTTYAHISTGSVVHIITGKSTAVLLELVRDLLDEDDDDRVKEQAGMLGGGGWVVRLK